MGGEAGEDKIQSPEGSESKSVDKKKMEYDMKKEFLKDQEQKEQYDIRTLYRD